MCLYALDKHESNFVLETANVCIRMSSHKAFEEYRKVINHCREEAKSNPDPCYSNMLKYQYADGSQRRLTELCRVRCYSLIDDMPQYVQNLNFTQTQKDFLCLGIQPLNWSI